MNYGLVIEPPALMDLEAIARWIARDSPADAQRWYAQVRKAILSLQSMPDRAPFAPENRYFPSEIRHLIVGHGHSTYRILFTVRGATVHVLHVGHGARLPLD